MIGAAYFEVRPCLSIKERLISSSYSINQKSSFFSGEVPSRTPEGERAFLKKGVKKRGVKIANMLEW